MKTKILGINIDVVTNGQALDRLMKFLEEDRPHTVFTPNPEMIMVAEKDNEFKNILNNADLIVPDGIGVVLASKLNEHKLPERIPGYDLMLGLFEKIQNTEHTVYFLGSAPGVGEKAKDELLKKYPNLKIIGIKDGYFDKKEERYIIKDIQEKKPDILLVGLGMAKQEKWIDKHKKRLPVKILVGVGGSLDGYSGHVKRAPDIFIKLGLEWFYRLIKQPKRIIRQLYLPVFVLKVFGDKIKK